MPRDVANDAGLMAQLRFDRAEKLIGAQCSGILLLAKLGLLGKIPACTDLLTKPWVQVVGVAVLNQPVYADGNVATPLLVVALRRSTRRAGHRTAHLAFDGQSSGFSHPRQTRSQASTRAAFSSGVSRVSFSRSLRMALPSCNSSIDSMPLESATIAATESLVVKSRLVINPLHEQLRFFSLPLLQRLNG
jgi:hypothetical protein